MTRDQLRKLKALYGTTPNGELARVLKMKVSVLVSEATRLGLAKDKAVFPGAPMPRWTPEEVERLTMLYPTTSNVEIAYELGKSVKAVTAKAHRLQLKKDEERLSEMGRENVAQRDDR